MTRRRKPRLSEDDLATWRAVTATARPLHPERPGASGPAPASSTQKPKKAAPPEPIPDFRIGGRGEQDRAEHDLAPTLEARLKAHPVRMDAKAFARMKRGKLRPERTLDLHGMTLSQAHGALVRFVQTAHADGMRLVIVVTGKGRDSPSDTDPIPRPRGLLRHQVPGWLHAHPLRRMVLQVTDAHQRHGGSGAYYVYLARARQ